MRRYAAIWAGIKAHWLALLIIVSMGAAVTVPVLLDNTHKCANVSLLNDADKASFPRLRSGDYVQLLGYYSEGDGGGQMLYYNASSSATVDDGFIFEGPGGVGRFIAVDKTKASCLRFGARHAVTSTQTARIQAACDAALANGCEVLVDGYFRVSTPINYKATMRGQTAWKITPAYEAQSGFGALGNFSGDAVIIADNIDYVQLSNFVVTGATASTGIKLSNTATRYRLFRIACRSNQTGADLEGWIGDIEDCFFLSNSSDNLILREANSVTLKGGEIAGTGTGVTVVGGDLVRIIDTTIECSGIGLVCSAGTSADVIVCERTYFEIEDTPIDVTGVNMLKVTDCTFGASAIEYPTLVTNVGTLVWDRNIGKATTVAASGVKRIISDPVFSFDSTSNGVSKYIIQQTTDTGFPGSPLINIVPNPTCKGGVRGWAKVEQINSTLTEDTTIVRRPGGSSYKHTETNVGGYSRAKLHLPNQSELISTMPGKLMGFSGWVYLPSGNTYSSTIKLRFAYTDDGVEKTGVGGIGNVAADFLDKWQFLCGEVTIPNDGSTFTDVALYLDMGDTVGNGESVYFSDLCVWIGDGRHRFGQAFRGDWQQSEKWGRMDGSRLVMQRSATPADASVPAAVGDCFYYLAPTAGGYMGEVCTTAGSPGTWKTFGSIAP